MRAHANFSRDLLSKLSTMKTFLFVGCVLLCFLVKEGVCDYADCSEPCRCSNGNFSVDFEEIVKTSTFTQNFTVQDKKKKEDQYIYFASLCSAIECSFEPEKGDSAACQYIISQNTFTKLGEAKGAEWTIVNQTVFNVIYPNGKYDDRGSAERRTQVFFTLDDTVANPTFVFDKEDDDTDAGYHTYIFRATMTKAQAKAGQKIGGGTVVGIIGLVLIILFIVAVVLYLVIGSVVMYKVKGARGAEVIPNNEFWKDLPLLIRDGVMFTLSPCVKKFRGGYQSL